MEKQSELAVIGECLIELSSDKKLSDTDNFRKLYGGDSIISAVMASRLGIKTSLITRFGDDGFKNYLFEQLQNEKIDTSHITLVPEQNGLYIASRISGEDNEFCYYKRKSAATRLNDDDIIEEYISSLKCLYTTGVTQSLSLSARDAVRKAFKIAKFHDVITIYDPNYTSCFMYSDESREFLEDILPYTDVILMSLKNDARHVFEIDSYDKLAKYLSDFGVETIIIKSHIDGGYYTFYGGEMRFCEFWNGKEIIDLTASGDTFNGAFIYAQLSGYTPFESVKFAAVAAGLQASRAGAIQAIPTKEEIAEFIE